MVLKYFLTLAILYTYIPDATYSYSNGAPTQACFDMTPHHNDGPAPNFIAPQYSPSPYEVLVSKNQIQPGEPIDINLYSSNYPIKGFMVQARVGDTPVGQFVVNADNLYGQTISCGRGVKNTLTHRKIEANGPTSLTFTWYPSPELKDTTVQFKATICLYGGVFWVGILSQPITITS